MLTPRDVRQLLAYMQAPPGMIDWRSIPVTPNDEIPPDQGDRLSAVPADFKVSEAPPLPKPSPPAWTHLTGATAHPLPRICHIGCVGGDVLAYKRALERAGVRSSKEESGLTPTQVRTYGARMVPEVKLYQREHGLTADGVIGPNTYASFQRHNLIDAYGYLIIGLEYKRLHKPAPPVASAVQHALRAVALNSYWHYAEVRPYPVWELSDHIPTTTDCSGAYGLWMEWGGMPSPFGPLGWSGYGNTDTMLNQGIHVDTPEPGDAILYTNPGHVIMCVHWPYGVSHGSEPGPRLVDARYRPIYTFRRF